MMKYRKLSVILLIILLVLVTASISVRAFMTYDNTQSLPSSKTVSVVSEGTTLFFDGPSKDHALIFYPGAMVEHTAYSSLLQQIAENGTDCFLINASHRFALLSINTPDSILAKHTYKDWYVGGHSLGGVAACMYAQKHTDTLKGVILLASYASVDLSASSLRVLSITGSEDRVVNLQAQMDNRKLLPASTRFITLQGGNHAQFGTYGLQRHDGYATITGEEQRNTTAAMIASFVEEDEVP